MIDTNLTTEHWTDPDATTGQLKQKVLAGCGDILEASDISWDEIRTCRTHNVTAAKRHVCAFIFSVLEPHMSEVEMAEWIGITRSTFRTARVSYFKRING